MEIKFMKMDCCMLHGVTVLTCAIYGNKMDEKMFYGEWNFPNFGNFV